MSKTKRPSIKGRGADIFLADDTQETSDQYAGIPVYQHTGIPAKQHDGAPAAKPLVKATFYLDDEVVSRLDDLWFRMRRQNKETTKSGIVNAILVRGIDDKIKQIENKNKTS